MRPASNAPWLLVAGGFHQAGGMDRLNAALVHELIGRGVPVHLVAHRIEPNLAADQLVTPHLVSKTAGSFFFGQRLLDRRGRAVASEVTSTNRAARVVVNGVNCDWPDINWVHFVNQAWPARADGGPTWLRAKSELEAKLNCRREQMILPRARLVIANSNSTRREVIERFGLPSERVVTVYPGIDDHYAPPAAAIRAAARASFGIVDDRLLIVFVGALGHDPRKGFATLWKAWRWLAQRKDWSAELFVAGGGRAVSHWRQTINAAGLGDRIRMLGFTDDVAILLAAADLLVSPVLYEPYGLNVQEAICSGVPAIVSACAGVAERYPVELKNMLLANPTDDEALASRLLEWSSGVEVIKERFRPLGRILRAHTEQAMARAILDAAAFVSGNTPAKEGVNRPASLL